MEGHCEKNPTSWVLGDSASRSRAGKGEVPSGVPSLEGYARCASVEVGASSSLSPSLSLPRAGPADSGSAPEYVVAAESSG